MTLPDDVREKMAEAIEAAMIEISVCEDADGMSYALTDAVAEARGEKELGGARDVLRDAAADVRDAALLALEQAGYAVVKGWQPIETAPKDESWVLLYFGKSLGAFEAENMALGFWSDEHADWFGSEAASCSLASGGAGPTHWMPLPKPPAEKGSDRE